MSRTLQAGKLASTVKSEVKITQGLSLDSCGDHTSQYCVENDLL